MFGLTVPAVLVTLLACWSYYAILIKGVLNVGYTGYTQLTLTILSVLITLTFSLMMFTYYQVIIRGPGSPLDYPQLVIPSHIESLNRDEVNPPFEIRNSLMIKNDGGYRYCSKCLVWKPDRSHHCSSCEKCILRMDHHCPWFGCCIGNNNHKSFIQFLLYSLLYIVVIMWISGWIMVQIFVYDKWDISEVFNLNLLLVFFLSCVFFLCVLVFSGFTIYQVLVNRTTIESYEKQKYRQSHSLRNKYHNPYDTGSYKKNWQAVMGKTIWQNINPASFPIENGLMFATTDADVERLQNLTARLSADLV